MNDDFERLVYLLSDKGLLDDDDLLYLFDSNMTLDDLRERKGEYPSPSDVRPITS